MVIKTWRFMILYIQIIILRILIVVIHSFPVFLLEMYTEFSSHFIKRIYE